LKRTLAVTDLDAPPADKWRLWLAIALFCLLMFGAGPLAAHLKLSGNAKLPLLVPGLLALVWMGWEAIRYAKRCGAATSAGIRYTRRMIPLAFIYVAALIVAINLQRSFHPTGVLAIAVAVLPALPLIGFVWAMARLLIEEDDEYQRMQHARNALVATGFMLVVSTVWGFLESFGMAPHAPAYFAFILWCVGLGFARILPWGRP
jgi:hypothetical protein